MMKRRDLWDAFARTGRVEDYLRYRGVDIYDAADRKGLEANARHETDHRRADYPGKQQYW